MAFRDPEDLNKDVLQKFSVIFDMKILRKNWHARQATNMRLNFLQCISQENVNLRKMSGKSQDFPQLGQLGK